MSNLKEIVDAELQRRVSSMSTDELLRISTNKRRARTQAPAAPRKAPATTTAYAGTVSAALFEAVRARWLDSAEIIDEVQRLRPDTPAPTIRAEISRQHKAERLQRDEKGRFKAKK